MKPGLKKYRILVVISLAIAAISSCKFPPTAVPKTDFYVSVKGSDSTGDGSQSKPWRHIQYAVDHAQPKSGSALRINILKGIYEETLVIKRSVELIGAGIGTASTWANDPLYPIQEVTVISGSTGVDSPDILIQDATSVKLQSLVVYFGGIKVINTRFIMYQVEIPDTRGLYAVQLVRCPLFYIEKSSIKTLGQTHADYGIDAMASSGDILETYLGNRFDHAINILPIVLGEAVPSPTKAMNIQSVTIRDSTIEGSEIYYADGIRIQGATNVKIVNTKITRFHPNAGSADSGTPHNPPYAGIEIAGWITQAQGHARVEIEGVTISGFNVGIGMNLKGFDVKGQNNIVSGIAYDVEIKEQNIASAGLPVIDFGGGPLGSAGGNNFAVQPAYAYYNNVSYDTYACFSEWNVPVTQVDTVRIYDQLDNPSRGRVQWLCQTDIFQVTSTPVKGRIIRDTLCYEGPGRNYPVVSAVQQNQTANIYGISSNGTYYVIENPRLPVSCWVEITTIEYDGDPGTLRIFANPPTSTPTKPPDRPDSPTATPGRP